MILTEERIQLLAKASQHPNFVELIGELTEDNLSTWLEAELGSAEALETFLPHGNILSKAIPPKHVLHIVSGNTPHAAFQSILRGLILGCSNTIKLPKNGLPELISWLDTLPSELAQQTKLTSDINSIDWLTADVVIAIGSDTTIESIQKHIQPHQTYIPHGHKISIGIIKAITQETAELAARDVSLFDQRGCLSLQTIYVDESHGATAQQFAQQLAPAMAHFAQHTPPTPLTLSEAGAIHHFRETTRFLAANSTKTEIFESSKSLDWTIVYQEDPQLHLSCLGRTVFIKPLPSSFDLQTLGPHAKHLSSIALHPFDSETAKKFTHLEAHRICPLGQSQQPSLFWHHDGFAPLAAMVRWQDIG